MICAALTASIVDDLVAVSDKEILGEDVFQPSAYNLTAYDLGSGIILRRIESTIRTTDILFKKTNNPAFRCFFLIIGGAKWK